MGIYRLSRGTVFYSFPSIISLGANENPATQPRMKILLSVPFSADDAWVLPFGALPLNDDLDHFRAGGHPWFLLMRPIFSIQIPGQLALICSMGNILTMCKHIGTCGSWVTGHRRAGREMATMVLYPSPYRRKMPYFGR